jgi:D,D-heptose 1,7-bisphosphate phosphatase
MPSAIFLDKDGTLLEDVPYNIDPQRMQFTNGAEAGLRLLAKDFHLIVVSNQSGVARGYFPEASLVGVEQRLREMMAQCGVRLNGFYYCPHHPNAAIAAYARRCECRKPMAGMLLKAAHELDIDLHCSWLIGDILDDVEAGRRAGCGTVLLDNGHETQWRRSQLRSPDLIAKDLHEAAQLILCTEGMEKRP